MRREMMALGGAIGATLLVASCCLAPALFIFFGVSIGALGSLSALEPFRPYFIAAGAMALLFAGRRIYRPALVEGREACADEACAPESKQRRMMRKMYPIVVVLFIVSIAYPYVLNAVLK